MFKFKNQQFRVLGIIPSRISSKRLPRKPLIKIGSEPLIIRVNRLCCESEILDSVLVATDSEEIYELVIKNGGNAMITSSNHQNGTERMAEVISKKNENFDIYVLINGDEALLNPKHIEVAVKTLIERKSHASMLVCKFEKRNSPSDFKVVLNAKNELMYISRGDIPSEARNKAPFFLKAYHIMAFKKQTILDYSLMNKSKLELIEDHEHLRLIENGYKISCSIVDSESISVDNENDLKYVREIVESQNEKT